MSRDNRKDPQQLLEAVQKLEAEGLNGRLRVFLGMCPGVGKTYAMLKAAREQQDRGVSVVIGVVETHGRKETEELLKGLRVIPKKGSNYKGTELLEMDIDTIIKQKPQLVLVDELAHTNIPESRHNKRYQDVEEILAAGIDVYTTMNIQHIESRNDQVAQITGVSVKETVPDSFLENAEQIEVIDLSPSELLRRLKEGKVYLGDRAEKAAQNFFKEEHLTALRELALRFTAEKVDQDLQDQMTVKGIEGPWNINERLLVAVSHSPYSGRLIRATRRMAYNLEAPWIALYVNNGEALLTDDQEMLQKNLGLARELGAEVVTIADTNLAHAIQKICLDKNVTQIVMGRPDRRFLKDLIARGTLLDQLVRTTSNIDVHVIRAERAPKYKGFYLRMPEFKTNVASYYNTLWFIMAVTILSYFGEPYVGYRVIGLIYLLAILVVSSLSSRGPILAAAIMSALVWDFLFVPPQFSFMINSSEDLMTLVAFFITAFVGGVLTSKIRKQSEILEVREERALTLYEFGKSLAGAKDAKQITALLSLALKKQFVGETVALLTDKDGKFENPANTVVEEKDYAVGVWVFEHGKAAGWSTQTLSASRCLCMPMAGNSGTVGVLFIYPNKKQKSLSLEQESFFESVINQAAIAIERLRFSDAAQATKIYEASEKLHQTLLNSISHEMRTPLTVILGSATVLDDDSTPKDARDVKAIAGELIQASDRLNRVIENLLDMSRLSSGVLALKLEWYDLADLINTTIKKLKKNLAGHKMTVQIADQIPLAHIDVRLFEHALSNLLLNAAIHTRRDTEISIIVRQPSSFTIEIIVADRGGGLPKEDLNKIFEKFYRVPGTPTGGTGLGLSIAKSIVEAHSGHIRAENREGGGAEFIIDIPVRNSPKV
jgi:two-component system, OmpR family, sensor histidine kinase KdpD